MVTRRTIPDAYTDYDDGRIGAVAPVLANIEAKIGPAEGGTPGQLYVLAGPDAKAQAKTIFKGGPLLRAIEEAFDGGSSTIYAWRIGTAAPASLELLDDLGQPALRLTAVDAGDAGNAIEITVDRALADPIPGVFVIEAAVGLVKRLDMAGTLIDSVEYTSETTDPRGVAWQVEGGLNDLWLLGVDGGGTPRLWHYDAATGSLFAGDTIDLSGVIPAGEDARGIVFVSSDTDPEGAPAYVILTDQAVYSIADFNTAPTAAESALPLSAWGLSGVNPQAGAYGFDFSVPDDPNQAIFVADPMAQKIYRLSVAEGTTSEIDLTAIAGSDAMTGLTYDPFSLVLYAAVGTGAAARVIVLDPATPAPTEADVLATIPLDDAAAGLGIVPIHLNWTTTVAIRDTNEADPPVLTFQGTMNEELVQAINGGQTLVTAESLNNALPAETPAPVFLDGGEGGVTVTNADYLAGLDWTAEQSEISWIHPVGATSSALWTATLIHCQAMLDDHQAERFAVLETAPFTSAAQLGTSTYLADLQTYVDEIAAQMALVGDRNAVIFPGGAEFLGADGTRYVGSLAAACGGVMASLSVQKSLINKPVPNALKLVPAFGPAQLQQLIQARTNPVRLKPGRGFVIAHSLTGAAPGSDYSRVNDLRAVYKAAKSARLAAQPYVGEENDEEGEGLQRLESAMARPLEVMRDAPAPEVDDFDLRLRSNNNDRLLGEVYAELGVKPLRAMEFIYTTVFLK